LNFINMWSTNQENYKIIRVMVYLKKYKIALLANGVASRAQKWYSVSQQINAAGYRGYKTSTKTAEKAFYRSVHASITNIINGTTFLLNSSIKRIALAVKTLLKRIEPLKFHLFFLKVKNKQYAPSQLFDFNGLSYKTLLDNSGLAAV